MVLNFPQSPTLNQTYFDGLKTWKWNGSYWTVVNTEITSTGPSGIQGINGKNSKNSTTLYFNALPSFVWSQINNQTESGNKIVYNTDNNIILLDNNTITTTSFISTTRINNVLSIRSYPKWKEADYSYSYGRMIYQNGLYINTSYNGRISVSTNLTTWVDRTSNFGAYQVNDIVYGNGLYVAAGYAGKIVTSTDTITWTPQTSGFGTTVIRSLAYGNGIYVAAGDSGVLTTSTDGSTWTPQTSSFGTSTISKVIYGNGIFVACGGLTQISTSTDGVTWTPRTSGFIDGATSYQINTVTYGNNLYIAGGASKVTTSTNGITWTNAPSGTSKYIRDSGYSSTSGIYYFVTQNNSIITSTDGIVWTDFDTGVVSRFSTSWSYIALLNSNIILQSSYYASVFAPETNSTYIKIFEGATSI